MAACPDGWHNGAGGRCRGIGLLSCRQARCGCPVSRDTQHGRSMRPMRAHFVHGPMRWLRHPRHIAGNPSRPPISAVRTATPRGVRSGRCAGPSRRRQPPVVPGPRRAICAGGCVTPPATNRRPRSDRPGRAAALVPNLCCCRLSAGCGALRESGAESRAVPRWFCVAAAARLDRMNERQGEIGWTDASNQLHPPPQSDRRRCCARCWTATPTRRSPRSTA